jgi:hypothetical protein
VDHPGFGVLLHAGRWHDEDPAKGDEEVAPWVMHTHFSPALNDEALLRTMNALKALEYNGCYSVEMSTLRYTEAAVMTARLRDVGERWRQEA